MGQDRVLHSGPTAQGNAGLAVSVLQCVAVFCSVMKCVAVCCSVLQCVAIFPGNGSRECRTRCEGVCCVAVCLQFVAVYCSELQYVAVCCSVLQWAHGPRNAGVAVRVCSAVAINIQHS